MPNTGPQKQSSLIRDVATQLLECESKAATRAMQDLYDDLGYNQCVEVLYETIAKLNYQLGQEKDRNKQLTQENDDLHDCVNNLHEKLAP